MKRIAYSLLAAALALGFNACEGHSAADLPEHYQHKLHDSHGDGHGDPHGKAGAHKEGEAGKEAAPHP